MTQEQVCEEIKNNKLSYLEVFDWNDNRLCVVDERNSDRSCKILEDRLKNFSGYKRIIIVGKTNKLANAKHAFTYELQMKGDGKNETTISGPSSAIGAMDYVNMFTGMMKAQSDLQQKLFELQLRQKQQDPTVWLPIIREGMGFLRGVPPGSGAIQGPRSNKVVTGEVKDTEEKLTDKEYLDLMGEEFNTLTTKISAAQYLRTLKSLNSIPELKDNIDNINFLLEKIADKPELLNSAVNFLK